MEWRTRRISRRYVLALAALLAFVPLVFATSAVGNPGFVYVNDENGANDQPGQKDLTRHGVDSAVAAGHLGVAWNWDITKLSGGNTGDACALFDTDANGTGLGKVDFALCVTISGSPASGSFTRIYSCGDSKVDRCTSPTTQVLPISSTCTVAQSSDDPFPSGDSSPNDTKATCDVVVADVGASSAKLVNTCSYPSQQPNSDPSDCVLVPRDAFLVIQKNAGGRTDAFNFSVDGGATLQVNGGSSSSQIPITTANNATHSVAEGTVPSEFTFNTASCSGASGSNGTLSGQTISGIRAASDNVVTCIFVNDLKPAPQLTIQKSCPSGANDGTENFVMSTGASSSVTLQCGGSTTVTLTPNTAYDVEESAGVSTDLANYTVDDDSDGDCQNASGLPRGAATPTCTVTNTLKALPQLKIEKSCPNGSAHGGDLFQLQNNGSSSGLNALGCGGNQTINLTPGASFAITEIAAGTTVLSDYDRSTSGTCSGTRQRGDALVTCTLVNDLKALPQLKIEKSCPNGSAHGGDLFQPQNNGSSSGLNALGCGGNQTINLTPGASFAITEAAAGTTVLSDYNRSTSGTCSGTRQRGDALLTCTLVNSLKAAPQLKIVKSCPNGAHASTDRFQPQNNGSSVGLGVLACGDNETITLDPDTGYNISEVAGSTNPATNLGNYTNSYGAACVDVDGIPRGAALTTCTITNTLKAAPQLKIVKSCPNGAHASTDRFQPQNNGSSVGLGVLACGENETITLDPDTGYDIGEVAGVTDPATDLDDYGTSYSAGCADADGVARGTALTTCTITNSLRAFTVITLVCEGDALYSSSVTLDGSTKASLGSSSNPSAADLCALGGARFTGKKSGTYNGSVAISP